MTMRQVREAELQYSQLSHLHKSGRSESCIGLQLRGPALGRWAPWRGLIFRSATEPGQILLLKDTHKILHILGCKAEAVMDRSLGQIYLLVLESFPERQGVEIAYINSSGRHLWELLLSCGQWCWWAPLQNPPSRSLVPRPGPNQ